MNFQKRNSDRGVKRISIIALLIVFVLFALPLIGPMGTAVAGKNKLGGYGFDGVGYRDTVMSEKVTFIQYDPDSILDDYAYVAAVPASVFYSPSNDKMVANPIMFTQDRLDITTKDDPRHALDAQQGVEYLMEEFPVISVDGMDVVQTINVEASTAETLTNDFGISNATQLTITSDDPYDLAYQLAESNWEYSDDAVIAVIKETFPYQEEMTTGEISGSTPSDPVITGQITGEKDPGLTDPNEHPFSVEENYKYIEAQMTWGEDWDPLKEQLQRGKDPDLQLYCAELGQVAASAEWNVLSGASEHIGSYTYYPGEWWYAVTYMPTQFIPDEEQQAQLDQMYLESQNAPIEEEGAETDPLIQDGLDLEGPIQDGVDLNTPLEGHRPLSPGRDPLRLQGCDLRPHLVRGSDIRPDPLRSLRGGNSHIHDHGSKHPGP